MFDVIFIAHMARARLRDRHQESLRRKLQVLKAEQAVVLPTPGEIGENSNSTPNRSVSGHDSETAAGVSHEKSGNNTDDDEEYIFVLKIVEDCLHLCCFFIYLEILKMLLIVC